MAPAAVDTLAAHFRDTGRKPEDYDIIATGDLGLVGRKLVLELMERKVILWMTVIRIAGAYFRRRCSGYHAGGSGCACSA